MTQQDIAETLFSTTPRTLFTMIAATLIAYTLLFATFATNADLEEFKTVYNYHVEEATLWQLERVLDDVSDKRWELRQRIENADGPVSDVVARDRDLAKRESQYREQIDCLKTGGRHCLKKGEH